MKHKFEMNTRLPGSRVTLLMGDAQESRIDNCIVDIEVVMLYPSGTRLAAGHVSVFETDHRRIETRWVASRSLASGIEIAFGENAQTVFEEVVQRAGAAWQQALEG